MSKDFQDQVTQSRSYEQCETVADILRQRLGCGASDPLPHICEVLDKLGFEVVAKSYEQMGDALGYALSEIQEIHLREDVIQELVDNGSDARFTALHEIAHGCTHSGESKYFRMGSGNVLVPFGADDEKAENHADWIAAAALMPRPMVEKCQTAVELSRIAGVPIQQARERMKQLAIRSAKKRTSNELSARIAELRARNAPTAAERHKAEIDAQKYRLWEALPAIPGEDSNEDRKCNGYWITRVRKDYPVRLVYRGWRDTFLFRFTTSLTTGSEMSG